MQKEQEMQEALSQGNTMNPVMGGGVIGQATPPPPGATPSI